MDIWGILYTLYYIVNLCACSGNILYEVFYVCL